jgi:hypothetical protein
MRLTFTNSASTLHVQRPTRTRTRTRMEGRSCSACIEPRDQPSEHRAYSRGQALERLGVHSRADAIGEKEVASRADLRTLASTLHEALSLLARSAAVGPFGQEQHGIRGGPKHVVDHVAVSPRDLFGELLGERRHFQGHSISLELLVWKPTAVGGANVGVRVRVRVGRGTWGVEREEPRVGGGTLPVPR